MKKNKKGFTLGELLVFLSIFSIVVMIGIPMFKSSFSRWEVTSGVRTVTSALSTARYNAIKMNRSVKLCIEENRILLKEKKGEVWEPFLPFEVDEAVSLTINSSPVFSPTGYVSPLCSIYVQNEHYGYKITLSIAGRIKVVRL
jgi:type II secretory pathway pseudopilin PulG